MRWIDAAIVAGGLFAAGAGSAGAAESLRGLAEARGISVGAAVAMRPFREDVPYLDTLKREFNMIVAENAFKWDAIQPGPTRFYWDDADALVAFAEANGMKVRGHTLVWHNQNPSWLQRKLTSRDDAIAVLKDHIQTIVGHFKGKVAAWDVVNEAMDDNGTLRDTLWLKAIGPDYIALAFQFAHEADPDAKLYYNDYSAEGVGGKGDAVYEMVKSLKEQGVPIDGVGWQGHFISGGYISDLKANGDRLAALGLEVSITELDIRMTLPADASKLERQADSYRDIAEICLSLPNCKAIVTWGFTDRYSWVPGFFNGWGAALPFDEDYKPKPAYDAMAAALQK